LWSLIDPTLLLTRSKRTIVHDIEVIPQTWEELSEFAKRELMGSKKKRGETVDSMKTIIAKMKAFLGKFKKL
tara:strand:- start:524 stop:739 length:216 start_codon:yes stop_codon:yes gene_type:complete